MKKERIEEIRDMMKSQQKVGWVFPKTLKILEILELLNEVERLKREDRRLKRIIGCQDKMIDMWREADQRTNKC